MTEEKDKTKGKKKKKQKRVRCVECTRPHKQRDPISLYTRKIGSDKIQKWEKVSLCKSCAREWSTFIKEGVS
jgi:ribosomal protein S14